MPSALISLLTADRDRGPREGPAAQEDPSHLLPLLVEFFQTARARGSGPPQP